MKELNETTVAYENKIKEKGYNLSVMWECDWKEKLRNDKELYELCNGMRKKHIARLNPRDGFFGGRTETFCLRYSTSGIDKIKYADFTSLYPWVNKYGSYPVGHPEVLYRPKWRKGDSLIWKGLIKCKVYTPKGLLYPVLPEKVSARVGCADKLVFHLCSTCSSEMNNDSVCTHSDEERALVGTWSHFELERALSEGYTIQEVYEVHHFDKWTTSLFQNYVNAFLKVKQECSELPKGVVSEEERQKYIDDFYAVEGILMERDKLVENKGLRNVAKLCLNSLWGKFGQRANMPSTKWLDNYADLARMLSNKRIEVDDVVAIGSQVKVSYSIKDVCVDVSKNTNIYVACMTTAQARIKLYDVLKRLGKRTLYCDTDSVIYGDDGTCDIATGNNLGQLKDEFNGDYAVDFCSLGPKTYSYRMLDGSGCVKMKGFCLNYTNMQKINMDSMLGLIKAPKDTITIVEDRIVSTNKHEVFTETTEKTVQFEYDKRKIDWNTTMTLPWGY